jgi:methyl-accepting chemotaxis protein
MEEIVASVRNVTDIMSEITAASQEQTAGIEQINVAISQMDQVTQQNAALVEQAAAAAQSMQDQAVELSHAVSIFRLGETGEHPAIAASPKAAALPSAKPAAIGNAASKTLPAMKTPARVPKAVAADKGDDWEEF